MPRQGDRLVIDGPAGALELALHTPSTPMRGTALVAHPHPLHGGSMDNKVVQTIARTLAGLGYGVARFNFRGVGASAGSFDDGVGETDDAIAVLDHLRGKFGQLPVVLSGFSFGSFVQARLYQREKERVQIERLLFVGLTANRIGPDALPPDTILIHGEQDEIVPLADVFSWARPQLLPVIVFPGCGHFFHGRLLQLQQVIEGVWR